MSIKPINGLTTQSSDIIFTQIQPDTYKSSL